MAKREIGKKKDCKKEKQIKKEMTTNTIHIENLSISNLAYGGMGIGVFDNNALTTIAPGALGTVLTSAGPGLPPTYAPVGGPLIPDPLSLGELKTNKISTKDFSFTEIATDLRVTSTNTDTKFGYLSGVGSSNQKNTSFGAESINAVTTGVNNVAFGYRSLSSSNQSGNLAIGTEALLNSITATNTAVIGNNSGTNLNTANNIVLGHNSGTSGTFSNSIIFGSNAHNTSAGDLISIGNNATGNSGTFNIFFGGSMGSTGSNNIVAGTLNIQNISDSVVLNSSVVGGFMTNLQKSVIVGTDAANGHDTGSIVAIGYRSSRLSSGGTFRNVSIGSEALRFNLTGDYNTTVGFNSGYTLNSNNNTFFGAHSGELTSASNQTALGAFAGQNSGSNSLFAGYRAGTTGGAFSVGLGAQALETSTSANSVAVGYNAGASSTAPLLAIGSGAGQFSTSSGIFLGTNTGANNTGANNIAIGNGIALTTGAQNVLMGENQTYSVQPSNSVCLGANNSGSSSIFLTIGSGSGSAQNSVHLGNNIANNAVGATNNIIAGYGTASTATGMQNSIILGNGALPSSSGTQNAIILGRDACSSAVNAPINNIAIGYRSLLQGPSLGTQNIAIGTETFELTSGDGAIAIGHRAFNNSGSQSIGIGHNVSTTGSNNVILGHNSQCTNNSVAIGHNLTNSSQNTILIGDAIGTPTGSDNFIVGNNLGVVTGNNNVINGFNITAVGGDNNTIIGDSITSVGLVQNNVIIGSSMSGIQNSQNVIIGNNYGTSLTVGNENVLIGPNISSSTAGAGPGGCVVLGTNSGFSAAGLIQNSVAIGAGAKVGVSNTVQFLDAGGVSGGTMRFQSQTVSDGGWLGGGLTTASIDNAGNIIRTVSDARMKKKIKPINGALEKIMQLKPVSYYFKNPSISKKKEYGLIAQDLLKVFPELVNSGIDKENTYLSVNYLPLISVLIQAVQELNYSFLKK